MAQGKDLIVLVADQTMEEGFRALLKRHQSLGIHEIAFDVRRSTLGHDPACLLKAPGLLAQDVGRYAYALVVFDREGCGQENLSRDALERDVEERLSQAGWPERCAAVVLDPELEVWVWTKSPHVEEILGWSNRRPALSAWLRECGHWPEEAPKPARPKETMEAALREVRKPRSSSLYRQLAEKVSLAGHSEPAFAKLCETLRKWFPK